MQGFDILGLNRHDPSIHRTSGSVESILKDSSENLNSFKEVEDALKELENKIDGVAPGESGVSLKDYLKKSDADSAYLPKGNYLTSHLDISNLATKDEIPTIPASLPASDVPSWAKEATKPSYTAAEVGALSIDTVIPEAQVQSDWEAEEGMGVILNKPELLSKSEVENLYEVLALRIEALENKEPSMEQPSYKGYFAIVPGETAKEWKANLASNLNFVELPEGGSEINSDSESGMIAVLYNKWIPRFDAYDEGAQSWQENETSLSSAFAEGKELNGEKYLLWYNTGATVDENTRFKIILP